MSLSRRTQAQLHIMWGVLQSLTLQTHLRKCINNNVFELPITFERHRSSRKTNSVRSGCTPPNTARSVRGRKMEVSAMPTSSAPSVSVSRSTSAAPATVKPPAPTTTCTVGGNGGSTSPRLNARYVRLNVGGRLFLTSLDTLLKQGDNMFSAMFSGRMEIDRDSDGYVIIDRDGRLFAQVLNYLRDGTLPIPETRSARAELMSEAKFYLVDGLVDLLQKHEDRISIFDYRPICTVPIIATAEEEKTILASTEKPVIKLNYNRNNNKYSYTSNSDDNLLKNIELFDKLSLKFNGRVMFLKNVKCSNDICSWVFFGNGNKVAEICCTSLAYATEKKHTKIEFPEAKIFEEVLNVLLFEPHFTAIEREHGLVPV